MAGLSAAMPQVLFCGRSQNRRPYRRLSQDASVCPCGRDRRVDHAYLRPQTSRTHHQACPHGTALPRRARSPVAYGRTRLGFQFCRALLFREHVATIVRALDGRFGGLGKTDQSYSTLTSFTFSHCAFCLINISLNLLLLYV